MKFFKYLKHTSLTNDEKTQLRQVLSRHVDDNPVRNAGDNRLIIMEDMFSLFLTKKYMFASIVVFLVLALGGGVGYAAEQSLPNDLLYPVKVHINEEVYSALAFSPEAKVDQATNRVERRLEEAHKLGLRGELTEEESVEITKGLEQARAELEALIMRFENEDTLSPETQAVVLAKIRSMLEGQSRVLAKFEDKFDDNKGLPGLLSAIRINISSAIVMLEDEEDEAIKDERGKQAAQGKREAATHKIEEVQKYLERKQEGLSAEERTEAQAQLQLAINAHNAGNTELELENYVEAFVKYQEALRLAQETKLYVIGARELEFENEDTDESDTSTTSTEPSDNSRDDRGNSDGDRSKNKDDKEDDDISSSTVEVEIEVEGEDNDGRGNRGGIKAELQLGD